VRNFLHFMERYIRRDGMLAASQKKKKTAIESETMNNTTTTISFSIFSNKGVYALLLGSGISKNSGIPTGWDIVIDLITKLAELNKESCLPTPEEWFETKYGEKPNYSTILSKLVKSPSERVNFLKPYFEPTEEEASQGLKLPTQTHKKIATLVKKGYIKVVITTNFDRLLEKALLSEGIEPIVIRHPNDIDGTMPLVHSSFVLIKINGDYLDTRFLNTEDELSSYDKKLNEYLLKVINEFGIISCGWSAKWDLGLVNIIKQSENYRFYSYWTYLGNCETELKEISTLRKGETVNINGSDSFFSEVTDKISALESLNDNHPLNSDIAVARLKKYIVKDEYKILLYDLIQNQLNETIKNIRCKDNIGLYPDKENLFPLFNHYIQNFEDLLHLIINGIYWAKEEHHYLFINILATISEPHKRSSGSFYEETRKLLYFPSLLALYTIGLSALKKNNFQLLTECFNLKVSDTDSDYSDQVFLIDKAHPCIVESKVVNDIISKNYKTPLSTYLFQTLKPYFVRDFYKDKEFDEQFDIFEYLLSLNYLYLIGCDWAPWGQFQCRRFYSLRSQTSGLTEFLNEAEKSQSDWLPLKFGMFGGKFENYSSTRLKLDEFLKQVYLD